MKKPLLIISILALITAIVLVYTLRDKAVQTDSELALEESDPEPELREMYGIDISDLKIREGKIQRNESLGAILGRYGVSAGKTDEVARASVDVFDVKKLMAGKEYYVLCTNDSSEAPACFIYHRSELEKVIFNLDDSVHTSIFTRTPDTVRRFFSGVIESSLYLTIDAAKAPIELALELADIYAWEIDFFRIQKFDAFNVVFDELLIDGKSIGVDKILACEFKHKGDTFPAYYYDQADGHSYFDNDGNSLQKAFLKAPLNYSRISSRYSKRRFHPVQKRFKAHLGTDYAAPTGTPIRTVGDGEIVAASYTRGNGNYVKVRHNQTYSTQYLHMSRIASGIKKGVRVKQGQLIGYVGKTGLATGPHLCFRFWKNGVQVDPLSIKMPPSKPLDPKLKDDFNRVKEAYQSILHDGDLFSSNNAGKEEKLFAREN